MSTDEFGAATHHGRSFALALQNILRGLRLLAGGCRGLTRGELSAVLNAESGKRAKEKN